MRFQGGEFVWKTEDTIDLFCNHLLRDCMRFTSRVVFKI